MKEQYTKQCDCPEIQGGWEPKIGDCTSVGFITNIEKSNSKYKAFYYVVDDWSYSKGNLIWLPTIGQLMGMVTGWWIDKVVKFYDFVIHKDGDEFETTEQAWLAFVMHELHGKKWDGNEWVSHA